MAFLLGGRSKYVAEVIVDTLVMAGLACLIIAFLEATAKMIRFVIRNLYEDQSK